MRKFLIRTCNVIVIVAALLGYNHAAKAHEAQDAEAKAEADAANAEAAVLAESAGGEAGTTGTGGETGSGGTDGEAGTAGTADETGSASGAEESSYIDGVYQGTAAGFGGDITVEVTIENGSITDLTIISAEKEDGAYLAMAEDIIESILEAQSTDVDTISGATFSSGGIKNAAAEALADAR
ncbi:MAG: FMN-binding protein [Lachnospiraceae bacterium]|nr:FMN-binding protein [Lachnospiraceae bacterium]